MRKTIARRLSEAKQTVPHFYLSIDCELDKLLAARKELNARGEDFKLSVNDFVIRAVGPGAQDRCRPPMPPGPTPRSCSTTTPTSRSRWPPRAA